MQAREDAKRSTMHSIAKKYLVSNVSSVGVEKPCLSQPQGPCSCLPVVDHALYFTE